MQTKEFTAREIAKLLNVPVDTVKRWARTFLPPDPLAGRQAGRARILSMDDCFILFFCSYLIRNEGLNIPESFKILKDVTPWLSSAGLLPSTKGPNGMKGKFYELFIQKRRGENFFRYDVKKILSKNTFKENGKDKFIEVYVLEGIDGLERPSGLENIKVVRISVLILFFTGLILEQQK